MASWPKSLRSSGLVILLVSVLWVEQVAGAAIEVSGLRRVSTEAFLGTLPGVVEGQASSEFSPAEAIRALYATGLFTNIQVFRQDNGSILFEVTEHPVIHEVTIEGNSRIPTELLEAALADIDVVAGLSYQPAVLADIRRELEAQYSSQGRYDAQVVVRVDPLPQNRVRVLIDIDEGSPSAIRSIELRGNLVYPSREVLRDTRLRARREADPLQVFSRRHEYDRDTFAGDLERISSFYLDRGHVRFRIENSQVSLEPDKSGVHLLTELSEGAQYQWGVIALSGEYAGFEEEIRAAIVPEQDTLFSRSALIETQDAVLNILGDDGYLFATVDPEVFVDDDALTVELNLVVRPNQRVFVRHIVFEGNQGTLDEVLRREMQLTEGELARRSAIADSRRRLQQLGFFRQVRVSQERVSGAADQIDLRFIVEEEQTGNLQASLGFQVGAGVFSALEFRQDNFLGTGKNVFLRGQFGQTSTIFNLTHEDPFFTRGGISRELSIFYERTNWLDRTAVSYGLDRWGGEFILGRPFGRNSRLAAGIGFTEHLLYISEEAGAPRSDVPLVVTDFKDDFGDRYADWTAEFRWSFNNQIGSFYATEGQRHRVNLSVTLPGSDLNYYRLQYRGETVIPLGQSDDYALRLLAQAGYGSGYGEVGRLPFYQNFFAGGPTSVRGFTDRSLSPFAVGQDGATLTDQPFGGDAMVAVGSELLIPMPFVQDQSVFRTALFVDAGSAFNSRSGLQLDDLSAAYGVDVVWRPVPILPLRFIVSRPLVDRSNNQSQNFRFTVWSQF